MGGNNKKAWDTRRQRYGEKGASEEGLKRMADGARASGKSKVRGDSQYYSDLKKGKTGGKPIDTTQGL